MTHMSKLHGVTMSEYSEYKEWLESHGCRTWDEMVLEYGEQTAKVLYADYRADRYQDRLF